VGLRDGAPTCVITPVIASASVARPPAISHEFAWYASPEFSRSSGLVSSPSRHGQLASSHRRSRGHALVQVPHVAGADFQVLVVAGADHFAVADVVCPRLPLNVVVARANGLPRCWRDVHVPVRMVEVHDRNQRSLPIESPPTISRSVGALHLYTWMPQTG